MRRFGVRMTAKKPFQTQDTAVNDTIFGDGGGKILGTSGGESTGIR